MTPEGSRMPWRFARNPVPMSVRRVASVYGSTSLDSKKSLQVTSCTQSVPALIALIHAMQEGCAVSCLPVYGILGFFFQDRFIPASSCIRGPLPGSFRRADHAAAASHTAVAALGRLTANCH